MSSYLTETTNAVKSKMVQQITWRNQVLQYYQTMLKSIVLNSGHFNKISVNISSAGKIIKFWKCESLYIHITKCFKIIIYQKYVDTDIFVQG